MTYTLVGIDTGQADTTLAIRVPGPRGGKGQVQTSTFPSLIGTGDVDRFLRMRQAAGGAAQLEAGEMTLEYDGTGYFIAGLALDQSRNPTTGRGDPNRYSNGLTLRLTLAAFGEAMEQGWMRDRADVRMVTGMPLEFWSPERRASVQRCFVGEHPFTYRGKQRRVTIHGVGVPPECAATLYQTAAQPIHQCAGDIGWGSTELYWAKGRHAIERWCKGRQLGVSNAAELISDQVRRRYGRALTEQEQRAVLTAYQANSDAPSYPRMSSSGRTIELNGIVPGALQEIGGELATFFSQVWADDSGGVAVQAEVAKLIGGGAYFFGEHIREVIPHIEIPDRPEQENARSYLAIAEVATDDQWARNRG